MFKNKIFSAFMLLAVLALGTHALPIWAADKSALPYLQPVTAKIQSFDKFGNGVLSVKAQDFISAGYRAGDIFMVEIPNAGAFYIPFVNSVKENGIYGFSLVADKSTVPCLVLAITNANFAQIFKANLGAPIKITRARYQAHTPDMNVLARARQFNTHNANFRSLTGGNIKQNFIYRSSSPIDYKANAAAYQSADRMAAEAHIATIINLANTETEAKALASQANANYYKSLLSSGKVFSAKALNFHYDLTDGATLARAFRFMLDHEGPYLICDTKGVDRTGFFCLLLEGLAGASKTQVTQDYMKSFTELMQITQGSGDYNTIKQYTVARILIALSTPNVMAAPQLVDWRSGTGSDVSLEQSVKGYLRNIVGLTDQEISMLKSRITSQGTAKPQQNKQNNKSDTISNQELADAIKQKVKEGLTEFKNWWRK